MEFKIDDEFRSLIPPLTDDESQRLEKSILDEGVREPIITWNGVIIDGHNRYRICQKHGIDCPNREREFDSRDAAKIWIIENQFARRNINGYVRSLLVLQLKKLYAAEAKKRLHLAKGQGVKGAQISADVKGDTRDKLAAIAGVSHDTIHKVEVIETEAANGNEKAIELRELLIADEKKTPDGNKLSINSAYNEISSNRPKPKKAKLTDDGRRICTICGNPIDDGDCYESDHSTHKKCRNERLKQRRYKNPDVSLLDNVAIYTVESLANELIASADSLRESWESSIRINESMGVKLGANDKKRLEKAIAGLFGAIDKVKEVHNV